MQKKSINANVLPVRHVFTYYLPQFHEIEENNIWWGKGFTEWDNVKSAKSLKLQHEINVPHSSLGFYRLEDISVIEKQYKIAREYGVDTFCFWHYWFGEGELLLEKPIEFLLESKLDVEFCFSWANHSWFNKTKGILLKKQKYNYDVNKHFEYLLPFFKNFRYRKIDNKPVMVIYKVYDCANFMQMQKVFEERAIEEGFSGIMFIFENSDERVRRKFNGEYNLNSNKMLKFRSLPRKFYDKAISIFDIRFGIKIPRFYSYTDCVSALNSHVKAESKEIPVVLPNWDSTIRHGKGGYCLIGSNPETFNYHLSLVQIILEKRPMKDRFIMIKSWNEWAEGNFIEPSEKYGFKYLEVFSKYFTLK